MKEVGATYDPTGRATTRQSGRFERIGRSWDRRLQGLGASAAERCVGFLAAGRGGRSSTSDPSDTGQHGSDRLHQQDVAKAAGGRSSDAVAEPGVNDVMERETMSRADELHEAREAIMRVVRADDSYRWTSSDLRTVASYGGNHGALGVALAELIEGGDLYQSPEDKLISLPEDSTVHA